MAPPVLYYLQKFLPCATSGLKQFYDVIAPIDSLHNSFETLKSATPEYVIELNIPSIVIDYDILLAFSEEWWRFSLNLKYVPKCNIFLTHAKSQDCNSGQFLNCPHQTKKRKTIIEF